MINWIAEIKIEDLPDSYRSIAEIVGIENTVKLSQFLGGLPFYFPKIDSFIKDKKESYIRKNFNGSNHRELAMATNYSERWVYEILKNEKDKKQPPLF